MKEVYTIDDMNIFGNGVIKTKDKPIFVLKGAEDDKVEIEIIENKKDYSFAKITKIIEESPNRTISHCKHANLCGGCPFSHVTLDAEVKAKQNYLSKLFSNITLKEPIIENNLYYRNKATFHIKNKKIGYYEPKSNSLVEISKCHLCNPKINDILNELKKQKLEDGKITIRVSETTNESMVVSDMPINITTFSNLIDVFYEKDILKTSKSYIKEVINSKTYLIFKDSFFQVNTKMMIKLYDVVKNYAKLDNKNATLLDLFCGTFSIGMYLKDDFSKVIGLEVNDSSIKSAKENILINNFTNMKIIKKDLDKETITSIKDKIDVIVVDPPRRGLEKKLINELETLDAKKIIYVSCNPSTLKRDLNIFNKYKCKEITPVFQFYKTEHIECVALLEK